MPTPKLFTPEDLGEVYAKLERADESIKNLNSEIAAFLKIPKGTLSKDKQEAFTQYLEHARRGVPLRFGVLSGEIVHHLRSCFDHIAWMLSSEAYRQSSEAAIAFPIFAEKPRSKQETARYGRKVKGITDTSALRLVEQVQPYNATDPLDEPLAIIHQLDRVDKHHTLVLIVSSYDASFKIPLSMFSWVIPFPGLDSHNESLPSVPPTNKLEVKLTQQIAFGQFGQRKGQPVIPGLTQLANATREIVGLFAEL